MEPSTELPNSRGTGLLQVDVEEDLVPQLATLFESGRYRV